jgi:surface protein
MKELVEAGFVNEEDAARRQLQDNDNCQPGRKAPAGRFKPTTKQELQTAVDEWCGMTDAFEPNQPMTPAGYLVLNNVLKKYGDIEEWDVSRITNMEFLFFSKATCDPAIGGWDVSSVTVMTGMFRSAFAFNQDLSKWDVSSVVNMGNMFDNARAFNQDLGTWDVSSVTIMAAMFSNAFAFYQNLHGWPTASLTGMTSMFAGATRMLTKPEYWPCENGPCPPDTCQDTIADCETHMKNGGCSDSNAQRHYKWRPGCVYTCGYCDDPRYSIAAQPKTCRDTNPNCQSHMKNGGCSDLNDQHDTWRTLCVHTCGFCDDPRYNLHHYAHS